MPLYIRNCIFCDRKEERLEPMNAEEMINCNCGGSMVRIIAPSNFTINGYSERNGYNAK